MERPPTYQVNGAVIRTVRMEAGLGTRETAQAAGISQRYLNHLENGYRRHMRPAPYVRLRTALGLTADDQRLLQEGHRDKE